MGVKTRTFNGIDLSKYQTKVDYQALKNAGCQFAIVRTAYRGYGNGKIVTDPMFKTHMQGLHDVGIPTGNYFFSQAVNPKEAVEEAKYQLNLLSKYTVEYPVYIDSEYATTLRIGRADRLSVKARTDVIEAFCEETEAAKYYAAFYSFKNLFDKGIDMPRLRRFDSWIAHYAQIAGYAGVHGMWQKTGKGRIAGIKGDVDLNISYKDYPKIIRSAKLNGLR